MLNNPCSLEHCHTNLFALQSLADLKWKCFRRAGNAPSELNYAGRADTYKDPVLIAYWEISQRETLCAWRRVPTDDGQRMERELWLFAVNEDLPTELTNLRAINQSIGPWSEIDMSYTCRSMLFKALHNTIERHLLSKGFARLNKWFVLPVNTHSDVKVPNLSFNFNFFLHGDSKVCASVDVQRHRDIFHLTSEDLEQSSPTNVILAPYGINGTLIGPINREIDMDALMDNWEKNYPVRHLEGLPEFVEVTTGTHRMFYPTCYVYKIGTNTKAASAPSDNNSMTKKSDLTAIKKSKVAAAVAVPARMAKPTPLSLAMHKAELILRKQLSTNLLMGVQRSNCLDTEKRQDNRPAIIDPMDKRSCECHLPVPVTPRPSTSVPFHRRARPTPPIRNIDRSKPDDHPTEPTEHPNTTANRRSSPMPATSISTHDRSNEWTTVSTPNSIAQTGPSSVPTSTTHASSVSSSAPLSNTTVSRGTKRSAMEAFDGSITDDDEQEAQKQTYDFSPTDSFLQSPLKRFHADDQLRSGRGDSTDTLSYHIYRHGQPTPPSPSSQLNISTHSDFDDGQEATSRTSYSSVTTDSIRPSSFFTIDGPSMADLETIIESHERPEKKEPTSKASSSNTTDSSHVPSPTRKDHLLPPPPAAVANVTSNGLAFPANRSHNGGFYDPEPIYNTPPGSSSSEKLQALHSPYGIIVDPSSHVASTFDTLHQLHQESIIVPFESISVIEQSIYRPVPRVSLLKSTKRYEQSRVSTLTTATRQKSLRQWKQTLSSNEFLLSPLNPLQSMLRQQHQSTPRSIPTPGIYSPLRSADLQPSPYPIRSVGSVVTVNSPLTVNTAVDVDSFLLNVLLNDSLLNLFRDINFDSCVLCACKSNELSIHGQDALIYLDKTLNPAMRSAASHSSSLSSMNNSCSCGFSAVVNLRSSTASGLFYEDETEITGIKTEPKYRSSADPLPVKLLEYIERRESISSPFDYFNQQITMKSIREDFSQRDNHHFYRYENSACRSAIEQARAQITTTLALPDDPGRQQCLHTWPYDALPLDSDQQLITMLRSLQPLLVDALRKRTIIGLWSTVDGPLTWKSFHQLLHAQNRHAHLEEQISGPQPIPYLLAGLDREWIMLAPYGLKFWDKLCLEPYSKPKDVVYFGVVPDNDYICALSKTYLRELSTSYELCRLGAHEPLSKLFYDQGLFRISEQNHDASINEPPSIQVDPWFTDHERKHPLGSRLKLYAQTMKEKLATFLSTQLLDKTLLDENSSHRDSSRSPTHSSSSTLDPHGNSNTTDGFHHNYNLSPSSNTGTSSGLLNSNLHPSASDPLNISSSNNGALVNGQPVDSDDRKAMESFYHGRTLNDGQVFLVIYIVDTFRYELTGTLSPNEQLWDEQLDVYVKKSLFRVYMDLIKDVPEKIAGRIHIQILPFESIVQHQIESDADLRVTHFKRLAFHIYEQLRRTVSYTTRAKSLTGFGPAASEEKTPAKIVMQLYTPAYVLSPKADFRFKSVADQAEQSNINGSILFCSYCLSDDQRYLLVSCSDERGEFFETCSINIEVPGRHQRKVPYALRIGLKKLWDFILRVVSGTTMPWRLVVGRLGRLGHGELRTWATILSKKNLVRCANFIRESCPMCHVLRNHDHPIILSACLISWETHPLLTILSESFELGEMRGAQASNNNAATLQSNGQLLNDISVTHILTLPTSASVQYVQSNSRLDDIRQPSNDADDLFGEIMTDGIGMDDFEPIPSSPPGDHELSGNNPFDIRYNNGSYPRSNSLSSSQAHFHNHHHAYHQSSSSTSTTTPSGTNNFKSNPLLTYDVEIDMNDIPTLNQQPLALGFYVSTIGTLNPLPSWMLSNGHRLQRRSAKASSVFKATLHINVPHGQHTDEMLFAHNHESKVTHPLDSNYTYVVLRHVLECYNRLSWLLIDMKSNERASCLPIHLETLLRLYQAFVKFV